MSTVTPSDRIEPKPAWTRCDRCKQRLWNDRIDIEVHRAVCPADMARTIRRLAKDLERLTGRVEELEARPEAHVVEVEGGPALDFEHEAPWPDVPQAGGPDDDEEEDAPFEVPDIAPSVLRSAYFDDEDDEDDVDPAGIRTSVR
jgi:hypothetical protein